MRMLALLLVTSLSQSAVATCDGTVTQTIPTVVTAEAEHSQTVCETITTAGTYVAYEPNNPLVDWATARSNCAS